MQPGQTRPLNVTQEANHRVFVGLGWDPQQGVDLKARLGGMLTGRKEHYDLDLSCFLYDADSKHIGTISAKGGDIVDESGKIYHSGDDTEGLGAGDDEQISVELKALDPRIAHIIFKVTVESGHRFDEVDAPEIQLVDAYSKHRFLKSALAGDKAAYVFARLFRDESDAWQIHFIDDYVDERDLKKSAGICRGFITNPSA